MTQVLPTKAQLMKLKMNELRDEGHNQAYEGKQRKKEDYVDGLLRYMEVMRSYSMLRNYTAPLDRILYPRAKVRKFQVEIVNGKRKYAYNARDLIRMTRAQILDLSRKIDFEALSGSPFSGPGVENAARRLLELDGISELDVLAFTKYKILTSSSHPAPPIKQVARKYGLLAENEKVENKDELLIKLYNAGIIIEDLDNYIDPYWEIPNRRDFPIPEGTEAEPVGFVSKDDPRLVEYMKGEFDRVLHSLLARHEGNIDDFTTKYDDWIEDLKLFDPKKYKYRASDILTLDRSRLYQLYKEHESDYSHFIWINADTSWAIKALAEELKKQGLLSHQDMEIASNPILYLLLKHRDVLGQLYRSYFGHPLLTDILVYDDISKAVVKLYRHGVIFDDLFESERVPSRYPLFIGYRNWDEQDPLSIRNISTVAKNNHIVLDYGIIAYIQSVLMPLKSKMEEVKNYNEVKVALESLGLTYEKNPMNLVFNALNSYLNSLDPNSVIEYFLDAIIEQSIRAMVGLVLDLNTATLVINYEFFVFYSKQAPRGFIPSGDPEDIDLDPIRFKSGSNILELTRMYIIEYPKLYSFFLKHDCGEIKHYSTDVVKKVMQILIYGAKTDSQEVIRLYETITQ